MTRAIAIGLVLAIGGGLIGWLGAVSTPHAAVRTAAEVEEPYRAEIALATEHGLVALSDEATVEASHHQDIVIDAGDCLAVVAVNEGASGIAARLTVPGVEASVLAPIVHLAACATAHGTATVDLARTLPEVETHERMYVTLLRGAVTAPRTYARLSYDEAQRAAFDALAVRARVEALAPTATRVGTEQTADVDHAVLLSSSRASYAALRALSGRADLAPAIPEAQAAVDPFASATDVHTAPRVFVAAGQSALAVVDAGALGVACVQVILARPDDPTEAATVHRVSIPDALVETVAAADPAIAVDRLCPATGLYVYTVDAASPERWLVSIAALDQDTTASPTPSHFADPVGGRHASSGLVVLPVGMVAAERRQCGAGSADACLALATLAQQGIDRAGTVREALEPLCRETGGTICDVLAGAIESTSPGDADELERRACATGATNACLRRGARYLVGASDLARAYRTFQFGCLRASTDCCAAASTMRDWELVPAGTPDDPAEPD